MLTIGFSLAVGIGIGALVVGRAAFRHIDQLRAAHRASYAALYERYHAVCVQADQRRFVPLVPLRSRRAAC